MMDAKFISIIEKVISDRGKSVVNNPDVFNSLLADYARGEFVRERRLFIRELRMTSFDELMKKYRPQPEKPKPSPPPPKPPAAVPPAPPEDKNDSVSSGGDDEDFDENDKDEEVARRIKKGFKCLDAEKNEKAARHFLKAIAILPTGDAYFGLACCSSRMGDYDEAIDLLDESKELYEEEGDRRRVKVCNNAIRDLKDMIKQKNDNRDALFKLGVDIISTLLS